MINTIYLFRMNMEIMRTALKKKNTLENGLFLSTTYSKYYDRNHFEAIAETSFDKLLKLQTHLLKNA